MLEDHNYEHTGPHQVMVSEILKVKHENFRLLQKRCIYADVHMCKCVCVCMYLQSRLAL